MKMLGTAISIAAQAFECVEDKGGDPYILHCLHVMREVKALGEQAQIVAVMHDIIEDTDWTAEKLIEAGFEERTVRLIEMVSCREGESYEDFVKRASMNPISRAVKMADLRHNSDIMRMKGLREKDFQRLEKYHRAYAYLKEAEEHDNSKS